MNHDRDDQPHSDHGPHQPEHRRRNQPRAHNGEPGRPADGTGRFPDCALLGGASGWADELQHLGARRFKRPEILYRTIRNRTFVPDACIVDLDSVPRNLVKGIDVRVPCPKLWVGSSAANPADIRNPGIYYARVRPDELDGVIGRLAGIDRSVMLPAGLVARQPLPFLVADTGYRKLLHHCAREFAVSGLITLHGDDPLELQLAAQWVAVETRRARIWEVRTEASIQSVLRKVARARRPGSDVTVVLSRDVDVESARGLYKSLPPEYSMIKLSARPDDLVDASSFNLPAPADRPADIEARILWFVCRATIDHGTALSNLEDLLESNRRAIGRDPSIEEIRNLCERSVRQHATMMEDRGEFMSYEDMMRNYERTILSRALAQNDWNLSAAARSLGLAESSLRYKLKKLGLSQRGA